MAAKISENVQILLIGAIRVNRGNGLRFYQALAQASTDELKQALDKLQSHPSNRYRYTHFGARVDCIERKLKETP